MNLRVGFVVYLKTLPTQIDGQVAKADLVLHIILQCIGVKIEQPLREERIAHELRVITSGVGVAFIGIKAARLREVVMFVPATDSNFMCAHFGVKRAEHTATLNVIFSRAHGHWHAIWAWHVRRTPCSLSCVIVIICLDLECDAVAQRRCQAICRECIFAQARRIIIAVIQIIDWCDKYATCSCNRFCIVGEIVVVAVSKAIDHFEREILIILLCAIGISEIGIELGFAYGDDCLCIHLHIFLLAAAFPLISGVINSGDKTTSAAGFAEIDTAKSTQGVFGTICQVGIGAKTITYVSREELKRAAQIVGGLRADGA